MSSPYRLEQDADTPLARWRFEETSGTTFAEDISSATATLTGTVTPGSKYPVALSGPQGGADFNGGYASASGAAAWAAPQTVEALVVLDTVPSTGNTNRPCIFVHNFASTNMPLMLGWNLDGSHPGRLGVGFYSNAAGAFRTVHMTTAVATGTLLHIVGVRTGTTTLDLYVNGTNVATGTVTAFTAGTPNGTGYIGRRWDQPSQVIDGQVYDLALYNGALTSTRVTAHYNAAIAVAGFTITDGGDWTPTPGEPHSAGADLDLTDGGDWTVQTDQFLAITDDGLPWTGYNDVQSQPPNSGGVRAGWHVYVPESSGTLTVDTAGAGWDTALTVLAADRSTVLASNDDDPALPAHGDPEWTGESSVTVSVTAGTTYYVKVTEGANATGDDGRYLLNGVGPRSSDATPTGSPAPAPPSIPAAGSPPAGVTVVPIERVSIAMPTPTLVNGRPTQPWTGTETRADWGAFQVVVAGVDVTWFRGFQAEIGDYALMEPFGCGPATITFPGITPHDPVGTATTNWLIGGYTVDILKVAPGGGQTSLWSGFIGDQVGDYAQDGCGYTVQLIGELWMGDTVGHQPKTYLPTTDIGTVIPVALNAVTHRRVNGITGVTTGIKTTQRGSADTSVIGYVQELLGTATTSDGSNQWTIARTGTARTYSMRLKDRTTVTWTVSTGQPGVEANLHLDSSTATNRIYGRGIDPSGYAWAGWVYPNALAGAAPAYPYPSPSTTIGVGDGDAGTVSGTGVSDWQRRMNETGLVTLKVDGKYDATDAAAARKVQAAKGLTVDGIVGPQTWAATMGVGGNGLQLDGAYRKPLAALAAVTPLLTNADGSFGGANPSDNRSLIVVDRDEDFGDGVTKAEATRSATAEIARSATPGWVGEIVLRADPEELSRFDIREGTNGVIKGWTGRDVTVHVAQVRVNPPKGTDPGTVTLTVDEHARDLVTLGAILRRDKDAARNPAMLPPRKQRRSQSRPDSVVEYDGESSGGIIPKHALYGGLWTVIRIPVSQAGKVAQVLVTTTGPASKFCLAFFGDAVTPASLKSLVGNPLLERSDGYGPFDYQADKLATLGFIEAIGGPGQAAGYDPGYQTSPHNGLTTPITGKLISTGSWTYRSARPPWLWVAEYSPNSCFISGRIYPAPLDT